MASQMTPYWIRKTMNGGGCEMPGRSFVRINPHTSAPSMTPAATWKLVGQSRSQRYDVINWFIATQYYLYSWTE